MASTIAGRSVKGAITSPIDSRMLGPFQLELSNTDVGLFGQDALR